MKKNKYQLFNFSLFAPALILCCLMLTYFEALDGSQSYYGANDKYSAINVRAAIDASNDYPYWFPWMMGGIPSVHSAQNISDFYPPNYLIKALNSFGMPWFWNYIIHFLFAGIGVYSLCLYLKLSKFISILPAVGFICLPYMTGMLVHGHGSQVMTLCYLPWIFLFYLKIRGNPNLNHSLILSILLSLQLLRGHVQMAYYTWMVIGLVAIVDITIDLIQRKKINLKWIYFSFLSLFLSIIACLKLYLPIISYLPMSTRSIGKESGAGIEYATDYSFSFPEILTFIIPSFSGFGDQTYWGTMPFTSFPQYMSFLILIFALYAILEAERTRIKLYSLICIIFFLTLSMGKNFISFYTFFYDYLPLFSKFRNPAYLLIIVQFFTMILAALGLSKMLQELKYLKRRTFIFLGVSFLIVFLSPIIDFSKYGKKSYIDEKKSLINNYKENLIKSNPSLSDPSVFFEYESYIDEQIEPLNKVFDSKIKLGSDMVKTDILVLRILISVLILLIAVFIYTNKIKTINRSNSSIIVLLITSLVFIDLLIVNRKITNPEKSSHLIRKSAISSYEKFYANLGLSLDQKALIKNKKNYLGMPATSIQNQIIKLNEKEIFRILDLDGGSSSNVWAKFHVEDVSGYHPAKLKSYQKMMQLNSSFVLRMLNVKYIIQNDKINPFDGESRVFFAKTIYLDETNSFKRRKNLYMSNSLPSDGSYLTNYNESSGKFEKIDLIKDDSMNISYKNFDQNVDDYITDINNSNPNQINIELNTSGPQFVIISEVFYSPGWKATLNGNAVQIHEINDLIRGIYIKNKGRHFIDMTFEPSDLFWGKFCFILYVSFISILLFLGAKNKFSKKCLSLLKK